MDNQRDRMKGVLRQRAISHWPGALAETEVHVFHDANDFTKWRGRQWRERRADAQPFAEGVFIGEEAPRHPLVDHGDAWRAGSVPRREIAPAHEPSPHRAQVIEADHLVRTKCRLLVGRSRAAFDLNLRAESQDAEWQKVGGAHPFDTRRRE